MSSHAATERKITAAFDGGRISSDGGVIIHERTTRQWYADEPASTVARINSMIRGWCGYFDQGPVIEIYEIVRAYTERRVRRWLMRRAGRRGVGFRQIPTEYLYETLGLYSVPRRRIDLPRAKV
jgi:hypothetical protein